MPSNQGPSKAIMCPFYRGVEGNSVTCEGPGDSTIRVNHKTHDAYRVYLARYCIREYRNCPIYIGLLRTKYGGSE